MRRIPEYFGNYPFPLQEKKPILITREKMKTFIYPPENPYFSDLNWLMVSSDKLSFGIFQLSPGATYYPPDVHVGDEVYYILKGTLTELNPDTGQCIEVNEDEAILLPKGGTHVGYNFTDEELTILWVVAPKIWDESGSSEYKGKMKLLKCQKQHGEIE